MNTKFRISLPVIALITLFCAPASGSAQSILLSSGNFALLGEAGITSTGLTAITGNVGISPATSTSITGFAAIDGGSATVSGLIVSTPAGGNPGTGLTTANGITSAQAVGNFQTAFTALAAMSANTNLTNQDLGGMTLDPGVYKFNSAATQTLSTTLTLDAQGQNNVSWVFQMADTFIVGANANVNIINLGSNPASDGIFWDVQTGITFGAGDQILGNYLAGTAVTLGAGANGSLGSRIMAQTSISLASNPINSNPGSNPSGWSGGLAYNTNGNIVPVPEPAAFLWLAPLGAMAFVLWQRRKTISLIQV